MSLFPAYAAPSVKSEENSADTDNKVPEGLGWSSYSSQTLIPGGSSGLSHDSVLDRSIQDSANLLQADNQQAQYESSDSCTDSESTENKSHRKKSRNRSRHDSGHRKQKKGKKSKKEKHKKKIHKACESVTSHRMKNVFLDETSLARLDCAFQIDKHRDMDNRAFSSTYYKHTAIYHKKRHQRALGDNRGKHKKSNRHYSRYFSRRALSISAREQGTCVVLPPRGYNNVSPYGLSLTEFISLKAPSDATKNLSECMESTSKENQLGDSSDSITWNPSTATLRAFNIRLSQRPTDTTLWLQFIEAQCRLLSTSSSTNTISSHPTDQQLYERQLAIVDRALTSCAGSRHLQLMRLQLLEQTTAEGQQLLQTEWRKMLAAWPNQLDVWSSYLCFEQHRSGSSLSATLNAFARCFRRMQEFASGSVLSHEPPTDLPGIMLRLLYKMSVMLCEAGYTELAVAIYQAQLELNLHSRPLDGREDINGSFTEQPWLLRLVTFEQFWDARLARIGECGARGWRHELSVKLNGLPAPLDEGHPVMEEVLKEEEAIWAQREQQILDDETLSINEKWLRIEMLREDVQWLPWQRRGFEDECEDVERIVSFENISRFLFPVTSPAGCVQLVKCLTALLAPNYHLIHGPLWPDNRPVFSSSNDGSSQQQQQQQAEGFSPLYNDDGASIDQLSGGAFCPLPAIYSPSSPTLSHELGRQQRFEFISRLLEQSWSLLPADSTPISGTSSTNHTTPITISPRLQLQLIYLKQQLWSDSTMLKSPTEATRRRAVKRLLKSERSNSHLFLEYARGEKTTASTCALLETIISQPGVTTSLSARNKLVNCLMTSLMKNYQHQQDSGADLITSYQRLADRCRCLYRQYLADNQAENNQANADSVSCRAWRWLLWPVCDNQQQQQRVPTQQQQQQNEYSGSIVDVCRVFDDAIKAGLQKRLSNSQVGSLLLSQCCFLSAISYIPGLSGSGSCRNLLRTRLLTAPSSVINSNLSLCHMAAEIAASRLSPRLYQDVGTSPIQTNETAPLCHLLSCYLRLTDTTRFRHFVTGFLCDKSDATGAQCGAETRQCLPHELRRVRRITSRMAKRSALLRRRPDFWRLALFSEGAVNATDKSTELLCYRAIQSCPWSKSLYLHSVVASGTGGNGNGSTSVARAIQLMSRAGVRVRLPLEELQLLLELEPEQLVCEGEGEWFGGAGVGIGGGDEMVDSDVVVGSGGGDGGVTMDSQGGCDGVRESSGECTESDSEMDSDSDSE